MLSVSKKTAHPPGRERVNGQQNGLCFKSRTKAQCFQETEATLRLALVACFPLFILRAGDGLCIARSSSCPAFDLADSAHFLSLDLDAILMTPFSESSIM